MHQKFVKTSRFAYILPLSLWVKMHYSNSQLLDNLLLEFMWDKFLLGQLVLKIRN